MKKTLIEVIGDPIVFLEELFRRLDDIELDVEKYELDHICYRVESFEEYKIKKNELTEHGDLLTESTVNGRPISTFKLNSPIIFNNRNIYLLELPAPKAKHSYKNGFEHAEFVSKEPLEKIMARYPQYAFEAFGIHKKINPDITLKLGDFCIRFHNQSLLDVIKQEKKHVRPKYNSK